MRKWEQTSACSMEQSRSVTHANLLGMVKTNSNDRTGAKHQTGTVFLQSDAFTRANSYSLWMGSPQTCCFISSSEFVYEVSSVRDCPQLGMTENGLTEPIMCNSHWQRLSPEDMARSGSGQFCFPKASSKFQNSIKCSFGQLCNTSVCCPVVRGVQPQPSHLL